MIIPSVDIQGGRAVQLVGGREKALDGGEPLEALARWALAGEVAVIDLDAALGAGENRWHVEQMVRRFPCRLGGGLRTPEAALEWLDKGARKVILGTAATSEVLSQLPRDRVQAAVDGVDGELVVHGWQKGTGVAVLDRIRELRELVGSFLVTFVEREGRLGGVDLEAVARVLEAAGGTPVTVAGGIATTEEIKELDAMGADAQVGMALYTERLALADAIAAPLTSDRPDGLWPTVVSDQHGVALGLVYSDLESLREAVRLRQGVYHSRSRGLWVKGETSGSGQELLRVDLDCDRDALRFVVRQEGSGFCHQGSWSCWGEEQGISALEKRVRSRLESGAIGSVSVRVAGDPELLEAKLVEEAKELAQAGEPGDVVWEAADLLYFTVVAAAARGVGMKEVLTELDRRGLAVRRRDGSRAHD